MNPTIRVMTDAEFALQKVKYGADFGKNRQLFTTDIPNAGGHVIRPDGRVEHPVSPVVWDAEVFVCPKCAHATKEEHATTDDGWYCKYCYTYFNEALLEKIGA